MLRRLSRLCLGLLLLQACAAAAEPAALTLALRNDSGEALRCQVIYAHWVTGELPLLPPGGEASLAAFRDPATREVFVPRAGDGRRLMIEELLCGRDAAWSASLTHVDLEHVKRSEAVHFLLPCTLAARVACGPWQQP